MKKLALVLLFPFAVAAHDHKKPTQPAPKEVAPKGCSCWWQPTLVGLGPVGGVAGIALYAQKDEKQSRRVELRPTDDGKGAKLAYEWRH